MLDGPIYNINKLDVMMIIYKNGTIEYMKTPITASSSQIGIESKSTPVKKTVEEKPTLETNETLNSSGHLGTLIEKKGSAYTYEGKVLRTLKDYEKLYGQNGYSDLSQEISLVKYIRIGYWVLLGAYTSVSSYKLYRELAYHVSYKPRDGLGFLLVVTGAGLATRLYENSVLRKTTNEFNLRAKNKIGQNFYLSPTFGYNPLNRNGFIGVNIKF